MANFVLFTLLVTSAFIVGSFSDEGCDGFLDLRVECGAPGISKEECLAEGCCYDPTFIGYKWCFKRNDGGQTEPTVPALLTESTIEVTTSESTTRTTTTESTTQITTTESTTESAKSSKCQSRWKLFYASCKKREAKSGRKPVKPTTTEATTTASTPTTTLVTTISTVTEDLERNSELLMALLEMEMEKRLGVSRQDGNTAALLQYMQSKNGNSQTSSSSSVNNQLLQQMLLNRQSGSSSSSSLSSLLGNGGSSSSLASLLGGGGSSSSSLASLLGGGGSSSSSSLSNLLGGGGNTNSALLQQLLNRPKTTTAPVVGTQLPDYVGTAKTKAATPTADPQTCETYFNLVRRGGNLAEIIRIQLLTNGCIKYLFSNPMIFLAGGDFNDILDEIMSLLGFSSDEPSGLWDDAATGPLDAALIPTSAMTKCIENRVEYNRDYNCKVGVHLNINSAQECLNIGCVYVEGLCFKCPYVKQVALANQMPEETCALQEDERVECPDFEKTFLLSQLVRRNSASPSSTVQLPSLGSTVISSNTGSDMSSMGFGRVQPDRRRRRRSVNDTEEDAASPSTRQSINPLLLTQMLGGSSGSSTSSSSGINPLLLSSMMGSSGTSSSSSSINPLLLSQMMGSSGTSSSSGINPLLLSQMMGSSGTSSSSSSINPLLLNSLTGSSSSSSGINPLVLQSLMGQSGSSSSSGINPLLLSSLGGGLGGGNSAGLASLLGGGASSLFGGSLGVSGSSQIYLKQKCEQSGCCWDESSSSSVFGASYDSCYQKALPRSQVTNSCYDSEQCGTAGSNILQRVVGGIEAKSDDDRPWQVMIRKTGSNLIRCSAAILCSQWVVTTASCLVKIQVSGSSNFYVDLSPGSLEVIYGTRDAANPFTTGTSASVLKIKVHRNYIPSQSVHDIALIQVQQIPFSSSVKPVCLPSIASGALASGTEVYVSGYGKSAESVFQGLLKEIKTVSIPYDVCREFFYTSLPPSYGIFCANPAEPNEDTCTGDGGAPAVTYDATADLFTLVGLNFGGSSDCSGSMPLVFVDIAVYKHWIESVTNGCCGMLFTL